MRYAAKIFSATLFFILFCFNIAHCADISISASVDKNSLPLDDQLVLEVNVSGNATNVPNPVIPDLPNFTVYSSGRSQSISIINGQMSSSTAFHFTLVPKSTGKFSIPAITLNYGNQAYSTSPIPVEVTASGAAAVSAPARGEASNAAPQPQGSVKNIFVTASLDKNTAYVNEQVVFTFRFFRRVQLLSNPQYNAPNFTSFWTEDAPPKNYATTVNGVRYLVSEVKTLLFPTKPGRFEIPGATLICNIEDFDRTNPFADDFFSGFFSSGKTQTLHTNSLALNVRALPENKPGDFKGAVGRFTISATMDKALARVGEPITLTATVSGSGNIKTLSEPDLTNMPGFRKYETVSSMNVDSSQGMLRGSKTFKTVLVPETPGKKLIGTIGFSFFDPGQGKYVSARSSQIVVDVKPAQGGAAVQYTGAGQNSGEIKVINRDIEYLKILKNWKNYSGPVYKNVIFLLINFLPLLLLAAAVLYLRWAEKLTSDVSFARRLRASKTARKYLKQAKALLKTERAHDFYSAVSRSLIEYIAHKLNVSPEGVTLGALEEKLLQKNLKPDTIAEIRKMLEECDMIRFSPASATDDMIKNSYRNAETLIEKLEKELR